MISKTEEILINAAAKYQNLWKDYNELRERIKEQYPEIYNYIPDSYYYTRMGKMYNLTPNYIYQIIKQWYHNYNKVQTKIAINNMDLIDRYEINEHIRKH